MFIHCTNEQASCWPSRVPPQVQGHCLSPIRRYVSAKSIRPFKATRKWDAEGHVCPRLPSAYGRAAVRRAKVTRSMQTSHLIITLQDRTAPAWTVGNFPYCLTRYREFSRCVYQRQPWRKSISYRVIVFITDKDYKSHVITDIPITDKLLFYFCLLT